MAGSCLCKGNGKYRRGYVFVPVRGRAVPLIQDLIRRGEGMQGILQKTVLEDRPGCCDLPFAMVYIPAVF